MSTETPDRSSVLPGAQIRLPEGSLTLNTGDDRYRLLVESVLDYAIFALNADGTISTWNRGAQLTKGYTPDEIVGKHISMFYTPEALAARRPWMLLDQAAREGRVEDEGWRVRKDGSRFWADVIITAVRDASGVLQGFTKVTRDLTERRIAEQTLRHSEERFRVLVQSVNDHAFYMLDPAGRVATWNLGAQRITGYEADEILGQHFSRFYPSEDVSSGKCDQELEIASRAGKFAEEGWRVRKGGSRFWSAVVIEPLRDDDGRLIGFAQVTRDMTERRAADDERVRLAQAREAIRMRDEFLSIASHELKTPLSAVQLQLQALLRSADRLDEKSRARAQRAFRAGERLSSLVDALLDVSRIAAGRLTLDATDGDLCTLVDEVADRFREAIHEAGGRLTVVHETTPLTGSWDRLRLDQVVTNLLSNALRYAGRTEIEMRTRLEGQDVVLSLCDRGPGVLPADRVRIFERFERAASSQNYGGLGLGLYVTREICEAHGGSIRVENVEPHGACFIVRLPRSGVPREGHSEPA